MACVLLVAPWVRSYSTSDAVLWPVSHGCGYLHARSNDGAVEIIATSECLTTEIRLASSWAIPSTRQWKDDSRIGRGVWYVTIMMPHWLLIFVTATFAAIPSMRWSKRVSVRTLLSAMTLVAVGL